MEEQSVGEKIAMQRREDLLRALVQSRGLIEISNIKHLYAFWPRVPVLDELIAAVKEERIESFYPR